MIMNSAEKNDYKDEYRGFAKFKSSKPVIFNAIEGSVKQKIEALEKLRAIFEGDKSISG